MPNKWFVKVRKAINRLINSVLTFVGIVGPALNKKEHIMSVAQRLFSEMGFEATSIREIAKEADINTAMISYYFGSKEHLLEEIIHNRLSHIKLNEEEIISDGGDAEYMLGKFIGSLIRKFIENSSFYNILHSELAIKQRIFSGEEYYAVKLHNDNILRKIISKGVESNAFALRINIIMLQSFIIGPFANAVLNKKYYMQMLDLATEEAFYHYVGTTFTNELTISVINLLKGRL